jgi:hypothetical protein
LGITEPRTRIKLAARTIVGAHTSEAKTPIKMPLRVTWLCVDGSQTVQTVLPFCSPFARGLALVCCIYRGYGRIPLVRKPPCCSGRLVKVPAFVLMQNQYAPKGERIQVIFKPVVGALPKL